MAQEIEQKKKPKVVRLAITSTVTLVVWVGFEIFFALTKAPDPQVPFEISRPLDPSFSTESVTALKNTLFIPENQLVDTTYGTTQPVFQEDEEGIGVDEDVEIPIDSDVDTSVESNNEEDTATASAEPQEESSPEADLNSL